MRVPFLESLWRMLLISEFDGCLNGDIEHNCFTSKGRQQYLKCRFGTSSLNHLNDSVLESIDVILGKSWLGN